jgi:hypothetical protein
MPTYVLALELEAAPPRLETGVTVSCQYVHFDTATTIARRRQDGMPPELLS